MNDFFFDLHYFTGQTDQTDIALKAWEKLRCVGWSIVKIMLCTQKGISDSERIT